MTDAPSETSSDRNRIRLDPSILFALSGGSGG